jgi:Tol biopolymer transport system component
LNANGTGRHLLLVKRRLDDPAWSPVGRQVAVGVFSRTGLHIVLVNVDGSGTTVLPGSGDTSPDWSPDGTRIAVVSYGGTTQIVNMAADGSDRVLLTDSSTLQAADPSWSPDGTSIAFTAGDVRPDIYAVHADGTNLVQITDTPRRAESTPAWSPDGARMAFSRAAGSPIRTNDIWMVDADGTDALRITHTPVRDEYGVSWKAV